MKKYSKPQLEKVQFESEADFLWSSRPEPGS